ncbi:MAG TPA: hypothetical protein PKC39_06925 [Ferruginibacter sp.]|nr:hypothetical protein [Ferruginibacter sp.]HMP20673.1 hypothetical protein [Ferruginibacter sp.]
MANPSLQKAAWLMLAITITTAAAWEIHLRKSGASISYDETGPLWAHHRKKVYMPSEEATVFIGSSRNKFDLDTKTWQDLTGETPIQLAQEGNCPLPVLDDLANDKNFKGKLVIDVTEGLFFDIFPGNRIEINNALKYYKEESPAQKLSFYINSFLESKLVLLDKEYFSLSAKLKALQIPNRKGVFEFPIFPMEFNHVNFERQSWMTDRFVNDTSLQQQVQKVWLFVFDMLKNIPPLSTHDLDSVFASIKNNVDKIQARGGKIVFVRTPSNGPFWMGEQMVFPREKFWDRLLATTRCAGIHFTDYPVLKELICPEWSHLTPADAVVHTKELVRILHEEKGWKFSTIKSR